MGTPDFSDDFDADLDSARMEISPRSMAAVWMVGLEDEPARRAEICIFEVFGDALETDGDRPTAAVGMGVHPFRDPAIIDEFAAERVAIDVSEFHVYAADWRPGRVDFLIDGEHAKTVHQAPDYPMQAMVAVFDFPDKAASAPADPRTGVRRRLRPRDYRGVIQPLERRSSIRWRTRSRSVLCAM